jgi:RNA polymerase sigma-70 factor, ECF subfamily
MFQGSPSEDVAQLRALAEGCESAMEYIHRQYRDVMYWVAFRILHDDAEAESVVQDVLMSLWNKPSKYKADKSQVITWLMSLTRYAAIDASRKLRPKRAITVVSIDECLQELVDDMVNNPEAHALTVESADEIRVALLELKREQREVILLSCIYELTHREIASKIKRPSGSISGYTRNGYKKLRGLLAPIQEGVL